VRGQGLLLELPYKSGPQCFFTDAQFEFNATLPVATGLASRCSRVASLVYHTYAPSAFSGTVHRLKWLAQNGSDRLPHLRAALALAAHVRPRPHPLVLISH
jgi:hypothetical protein